MPSTSQAQQRLFGAVQGGAKFPLAKKIRAQMTSKQIRDFASTTRKNLPNRIKPAKVATPKAASTQFLRSPRTTMARLYR